MRVIRAYRDLGRLVEDEVRDLQLSRLQIHLLLAENRDQHILRVTVAVLERLIRLVVQLQLLFLRDCINHQLDLRDILAGRLHLLVVALLRHRSHLQVALERKAVLLELLVHAILLQLGLVLLRLVADLKRGGSHDSI